MSFETSNDKKFNVVNSIVNFVVTVSAIVVAYYLTAGLPPSLADIRLLVIIAAAVAVFIVYIVISKIIAKRREQSERRQSHNRLRKIYTPRTPLEQMFTSGFGREIFDQVDYAGVLWNVTAPKTFGYPPNLKLNDMYTISHIEAEAPPRCPTYGTEIEEKRNFLRLGYMWRCPKCKFKKRSWNNYNHVKELVSDIEISKYLDIAEKSKKLQK